MNVSTWAAEKRAEMAKIRATVEASAENSEHKHAFLCGGYQGILEIVDVWFETAVAVYGERVDCGEDMMPVENGND